MSLFDLTETVCIVTGATKGIGRETAFRMAEHGARVVVTSRSIESAAAIADVLNDVFGVGRATPAIYDVRDPVGAESLARTTLDRWGRIDHVVANAAELGFGRVLDVDDALLEQSLKANVTHQVALVRHVAPIMQKQGGGSFSFVSSTLGLIAAPPYLPYSLTKAMLVHLVRILAVEFGRDNIRFNAIAPGIIATEGSSFIHANEAALHAAIGKTPLARIGRAEEIAGCAVFLASPAGGFVTGQTLVADGGQILRGMEGAEEVLAHLGV